MNIALVLQHKLAAGIQRLIPDTAVLVPPPRLLAQRPAAAPHTASLCNNEVSALPVSRHATSRTMPLRVLRVVESGQPRSCTGRLVISGRMADVCAELDRLVERETALH